MRYRNMSGNMSAIHQLPNRAPARRYSFGLAIGLFIGATLLGVGAANGQSFDCRKARSADEWAICQESGLAKLDQELASLKRQRKEKHHKAERDKADDNETPFLNARRRCGENRACLEQSYRNRIQELTEDPERPSPHTDSKHSDRQKAVKRDRGKTEDERTDAEDAKRGATETVGRAGDRASGDETTGSEPPRPQPKRSAPATAHTAARPPAIQWVDPPPTH